MEAQAGIGPHVSGHRHRQIEPIADVRYHVVTRADMGKRKKKPLPPRMKSMNRERRLQVAPRWLAAYEGSNLIRSYRKRYGVDWLCAITELQLLGVELDPVHVAQLRRTVEEQAKQKRRLEPQQTAIDEQWAQWYPYAEGEYYFVAGHTSNGVPYGVTWEEARAQGLIGAEEPPQIIDG